METICKIQEWLKIWLIDEIGIQDFQRFILTSIIAKKCAVGEIDVDKLSLGDTHQLCLCDLKF